MYSTVFGHCQYLDISALITGVIIKKFHYRLLREDIKYLSFQFQDFFFLNFQNFPTVADLSRSIPFVLFPDKVTGCSRAPRVLLVGSLAFLQFFFSLNAFVRLKGQYHKGSMAKTSGSKMNNGIFQHSHLCSNWNHQTMVLLDSFPKQRNLTKHAELEILAFNWYNYRVIY